MWVVVNKLHNFSISSLILVGWCEEGHPATKNLLQLSRDRQLPYGD